MKIAIVGTRGVPNRYGGFEQFAEKVSSALADRGHEVTVYCRKQFTTPDDVYDRRVRRVILPSIHRKHLDTWSSGLISMAHAAFGGYALVLLCNVANSPFAFFPRLLGKPVVLNVDGLDRQRGKWNALGQAALQVCEWLSVFTPTCVVTDAAPIAYPWTIAMRGKNPAAFDLELLNPYQGIDASRNERHNVRNICGQPLRRGIWVDSIYDIGRIENVHFNPWWNGHDRVYRWQTENGEAFLFGRADWEYVLNTFCFGYQVGYKFVHTGTGECNGNFVGIGADDCNRAVLVEQSAPYGLLIANGEFTSFHGDDPTMVEVLGSNKGVVRFSNSAFWGPCNQIAKIGGQGTVGFSDCTFVEWKMDRAAIQVSAGSVLIRGCEFRQNQPHISLGESVDRAVITGNLFAGPAQIRNEAKKNVQIGLNAAL